MIDRILLILKTQNLSSSQFADEIGVQRSSISHILSGRNNPSLEFVTKILKRFPDINSDWIIFGKGSMYKGSDSKTEVSPKEVKKGSVLQPELFNLEDEDDQQVEIQPIKPDELHLEKKYENPENMKAEENIEIPSEIQSVSKGFDSEKKELKTEPKIETDRKISEIQLSRKNVIKIVIFYSDKTFGEYYPE